MYPTAQISAHLRDRIPFGDAATGIAPPWPGFFTVAANEMATLAHGGTKAYHSSYSKCTHYGGLSTSLAERPSCDRAVRKPHSAYNFGDVIQPFKCCIGLAERLEFSSFSKVLSTATGRRNETEKGAMQAT